MRVYFMVPVAVGLLAACGTENAESVSGEEPAQEQSGAKGTSASTDALFNSPPQVAIVNGEQAATIDISLPTNIDSLHPDLADEIRSRANRGTEAFIAAAQADKEAAAEEGFEFRPHSLDVKWAEVGPAEGRLAGYLGTYSTYTGGAHPNVGFDVLNWDRETASLLAFEDLFENDEAARSVMTEALKRGLLKQKRKRLEGTGISEDEMMTAWVSPAFDGNPAVFQGFTVGRSSEPDKAGGFVYHFAPYEVGAYAEGIYEVGVGYQDFADELHADYADSFGGEPILP
ncbi:DUF3298 and DUF4163 domain-containing protein [Henriciella sp.]|uniref:DUF3298 and DUF4163 domain-containing protein n=1 Tax=Henriciella sp. TaxID=1968823 RepID=UPI00262CE465|nr:DUF3298 and DUF4163 domain-containing protein [Henriciella sp.]